ncbi:MAG: hypothetical protein FWG10_13325 [Eubacteriaceae bacterium]|nr:hypothetical protein [Eubacteriaceae bacterium]
MCILPSLLVDRNIQDCCAIDSLPNLAAAIRESMSASRLGKLKRRFEKHGLVILDELVELLFNILSARPQSKPIIVAASFRLTAGPKSSRTQCWRR